MLKHTSWHYLKIRRKEQATTEPTEAIRFLRVALAGGRRAATDLLHEAQMYEISFSDLTDAAKAIGIAETWDPQTHHLYWETAHD